MKAKKANSPKRVKVIEKTIIKHRPETIYKKLFVEGMAKHIHNALKKRGY